MNQYFILCLLQIFFATAADRSRSFKIDYERKIFVKNGEPFRYISGEIHYNRIHPNQWNDRLSRLRAAGLNAIQTYVPWNFHETFEGKFDFSGAANLTRFIQLAQKNDLFVLLRAGPYICAEWEYGGLPYWLIKKQGIKLREYSVSYIAAVDKYFQVLLPLMKPLLYNNGGPILMVQVENEYGSYSNDKKYMTFLRNLFKKHLGNDVVLYTTDGAGDWFVKRGMVDGVFPTVDFGPTNNSSVVEHFEIQRNYSKGGPLVNSEFYPGWFTLWGQNQPDLPSTNDVLDTMISMYNVNASFSFYMFHGGSNFGFWNGAETDGAVITSYDYGAPVSESGDITSRYLAIREWIKTLPDWNHRPLDVPKNNSASDYGKVEVKKFDTLLGGFQNALQSCKKSVDPLSFEDLDHPYGFVLYRIVLPFAGEKLEAPNLKDHGFVFLNGLSQGVIVHGFLNYSKTYVGLKNSKKGDALIIIVENRGRKTYLTEIDSKGLLSNITLDGHVLQNWQQCGVDLGKTSYLANINDLDQMLSDFPDEGRPDTSGIYFGSFEITGEISDTWFHPEGFKKGQLLINGYNVGRYWPHAGPQVTLYVPAPILKKKNSVVLIELLGRNPASMISFVKGPIYKNKKYAKTPTTMEWLFRKR